jgi:hypothetical protein
MRGFERKPLSGAFVPLDLDVLVNAGVVLRQVGLPNLTLPYGGIAIDYSFQAYPTA